VLSRAVSAELVVAKLQQQLREKDLKLTDIRLEALTSAHQLDHLRDAINRMQVRPHTHTHTHTHTRHETIGYMFGERTFSHAGPATWNALSDHVRNVADPVKFRQETQLSPRDRAMRRVS